MSKVDKFIEHSIPSKIINEDLQLSITSEGDLQIVGRHGGYLRFDRQEVLELLSYLEENYK